MGSHQPEVEGTIVVVVGRAREGRVAHARAALALALALLALLRGGRVHAQSQALSLGGDGRGDDDGCKTLESRVLGVGWRGPLQSGVGGGMVGTSSVLPTLVCVWFFHFTYLCL